MKKKIIALFTIAVFFLCIAGTATISRLRIVSEEMTTVENPEMSQVFYGELTGSADVFKIDAKEPFDLYVNVLVPNVDGAKKDTMAELYTGENLPGQEKTGDGTMQVKKSVALLDGKKADWQNYSEPLMGENLLKGPEYKDTENNQSLKAVRMDPGEYFIQVINDDNEGKYALKIGLKEQFSFGEAVNTLKLIPKINMEFFGKSSVSAFFNLTGLIVLSFIVIFVLLTIAARKILIRRGKKAKKKEKNEEKENLGEVCEEEDKGDIL